MMTEYLNKLNDFINNPQIIHDMILIPEDLRRILVQVLDHPFIKFHNKIVKDIAGHTFRYIEKARVVLMDKVVTMLKTLLFVHMITIIIIVFAFLIYIKNQIKHQLNLIDELISIIFTVPLTIYNSSPKLKK